MGRRRDIKRNSPLPLLLQTVKVLNFVPSHASMKQMNFMNFKESSSVLLLVRHRLRRLPFWRLSLSLAESCKPTEHALQRVEPPRLLNRGPCFEEQINMCTSSMENMVSV